MIPRRPRRLILAALAALGLAAAPAAATDGSLYPYDNAAVGVGPQFAASPSGGTWTISAPALSPAVTGGKWEARWVCPVAGSELATVQWGALRAAAPSSLQQEVLANGGVVWAEPDVNMPQSPSAGRQYSVALPSGACDARLRLDQVEQRNQQARTYWIDHPLAWLRDVGAPTAVLRSVTSTWVSAATGSVRVEWSASDNFGADGIGAHRWWIAGIPKFVQMLGQGDFGAGLDVEGVPDGAQNVHLQVDGDGTGAGAADGTIYVDRTPPVAGSLGVGYSGRPGRADFAWLPDDATSGVATSAIELNRAPGGSGWVEVASRPGRGAQSALDADTGVVADGVHAWRIRVHDAAGNVAYQDAPVPVVVDTTPPTVDVVAPTGWVSVLPLDLTAHDNLEAVLGLGATEVEVNTAADGGASGAWVPLAASARPPGHQTDRLPLAGLQDGLHLVRVRVRNGGPFGADLVGEHTAQVKVDLTSPSLSAATFAAAGPDRLKVSWVAQDGRAGVASATVQWLKDGEYRTLASAPVADGAQTLLVDTSSVDNGPQSFRLVVADAAGNTSEARSPAAVSVDHEAPTVSGLALQGGPPWRLWWTQSDPIGGFGACPTRIEVDGPGTGSQWREILSLPAREGAQSAVLPVEGLAAGAYRVRVVACDAAGATTAAETGGLLIRLPEPAVVADGGALDPFATLRAAHLDVRVRGARLRRISSGLVMERRLVYGETLDLRGRLRDSRGRPLGHRPIEVRGFRGRVLGRTLTHRDGRFRLRVRPEATGGLAIGVPAGRELLPVRRGAGVRAVVRPTVVLAASSRQALAFGAPVVFTGRIRPAPDLLGGTTRKSIILEWLDPLRRVWRPVLNARARSDGTFRLKWRFGVRKLTIPMRVRVPLERGWPLGGALSTPVRVAVR